MGIKESIMSEYQNLDFILYGLQCILTIIRDETIENVKQWINRDCNDNVNIDHTIQFAVYIIETYKESESDAADLAHGILEALNIDINDAMNEYGMNEIVQNKPLELMQSETMTYSASDNMSYQQQQYETYLYQQQQQQQYLYYQYAMQQQQRLSNGMQPYMTSTYNMPYNRSSIHQPMEYNENNQNQLVGPPQFDRRASPQQQAVINFNNRRTSHINTKLPQLNIPTTVHRKSSDVHISHKMHSTLAQLMKTGSVMTKYPSVHTEHSNYLEIQSQKRSKYKLVRMDADWQNIEFHNIRSSDVEKEAQSIKLIKGKAPKRLPLANIQCIDSSFSLTGKESVFSSFKHSKEILVYASDRKGKQIVIKLVCSNQNIAKRWTRALNQVIVLMKN